jgi:hypothetical protein
MNRTLPGWSISGVWQTRSAEGREFDEKDNRECLSLSSVDVFGSDGQRPRGKRCFWGPLEDRSCGSHAGGSYGQTVHYALSRLEPIKRHPAGTEGFWGGTKFTCDRQSTRTAEPD